MMTSGDHFVVLAGLKLWASDQRPRRGDRVAHVCARRAEFDPRSLSEEPSPMTVNPGTTEQLQLGQDALARLTDAFARRQGFHGAGGML